MNSLVNGWRLWRADPLSSPLSSSPSLPLLSSLSLVSNVWHLHYPVLCLPHPTPGLNLYLTPRSGLKLVFISITNLKFRQHQSFIVAYQASHLTPHQKYQFTLSSHGGIGLGLIMEVGWSLTFYVGCTYYHLQIFFHGASSFIVSLSSTFDTMTSCSARSLSFFMLWKQERPNYD